VLRSARWSDCLGGGKEGRDDFVSEDDQRSHRPQACEHRFIAACPTDAADDLFSPEFLEIIGGAARTVLGWVLFGECTYLGGELGRGEAVG
jgi:hypothetical protein